MVIISTKRGVSLGAGFFPFVCGAALIVLGVLLVLRGLHQNGKVDYFKMILTREDNIKTVVLLVLMSVLMLVGWKISKLFFACLPLYAILVNKVLKRSWIYSIVFTIAVTAFIYFLFHVGFHVTFRP